MVAPFRDRSEPSALVRSAASTSARPEAAAASKSHKQGEGGRVGAWRMNGGQEGEPRGWMDGWRDGRMDGWRDGGVEGWRGWLTCGFMQSPSFET